MSSLDAFERESSNLKPGHRIVAVSAVLYDPRAMMFVEHRSIRQELAEPSHSQEITIEWLRDALREGVLGRLEWHRSTPALPEWKSPKAWIRVHADEVREWLRLEEARRVYDGHLAGVIYGQPTLSRAERVAAILCDPKVGNNSNRPEEVLELVKDPVNAADSRRLPLRLILPAFPFKDQNPFRTEVAEDGVDLAEIAFLIRLHCLAVALRQVCSFGVEVVVLSDGTLYQPVFGADSERTVRYLETVRAWRDALNLRTTVKIIELSDVIRAHRACSDVRLRLEAMLREAGSTDAIIEERLRVLQRGMLQNLCTRADLDALGRERLWGVIYGNELEMATDATGLLGRSREGAIQYAAISMSTRVCGLYEWFSPKAIRLTIHPKAGQVAAPSIGDALPWNGVAVLSGVDGGPDAWEVKCTALWKVQLSDWDLRVAVQAGSGDTIAYVVTR